MPGSATCKPLFNEQYRAHNDSVGDCVDAVLTQLSGNRPKVHVDTEEFGDHEDH